MTEPEVRAVALVRAIDESPRARALVPATMLVEAQLVAGDRTDADAWFVRRARYLLDGVLAPLAPLADRLALHPHVLGWIVPVAAVAGVAANSLGPAARIHVLYNPIVLLLAWNVAVYAALLWRRAAAWRGSAGPAPSLGLGGRLLLGPLARRFLTARLLAERWRETAAADFSAIAPRFAGAWLGMMRPALAPALACSLHLGAVGMALGAVAGMYVRGLFFAYDVVWRSTFVTDPALVARLCGLVLAPGAFVLGRPLPSVADASGLLSEAGSPAAPWIHLLAAAVVVVVVVPRLALALVAGLRLRRALGTIGLDRDDPYVRDVLGRAASLDAGQVRRSIEHDVRAACGRFAGDVAAFVASELYDRKIVPALEEFRTTGGTLDALDGRLREHCRVFEPVLAGEMERAQQALETRLAEQIAWRLGALEPDDAIASERVRTAVDGASVTAGTAIGDRVGDVLASGVGGTVTAAVAVVTGTVSGGFGHSLGTALLVGIVHSGPVGWLLGAIGGGVVAGAGLYLGRDRLREGLKHVRLPPFAARAALWRIRSIAAAGRERCVTAVRQAIDGELDAVVTRIADRIWQRLEPRLGEQLRPAVAPETA